jgi:hypothetical protein
MQPNAQISNKLMKMEHFVHPNAFFTFVIFFNYGNDVDIGILKLSLNPIRLYIRFNRIKNKKLKTKNSVLNGDFFVA